MNELKVIRQILKLSQDQFAEKIMECHRTTLCLKEKEEEYELEEYEKKSIKEFLKKNQSTIATWRIEEVEKIIKDTNIITINTGEMKNDGSFDSLLEIIYQDKLTRKEKLLIIQNRIEEELARAK